MPTALAYTYCTEDDINALLGVDGVTGRLDDDDSGTVSAAEDLYLTAAINWATSKVNLYCLGFYEALDLSTSFIVNQWATVIACHWLSSRRGNPAPGSFKELYEETIKDLERIKSAEYQIPDIGYRTAAWPWWSNIRVDHSNPVRKVRVERPISEKSAIPYRDSRDRGADALGWLE